MPLTLLPRHRFEERLCVGQKRRDDMPCRIVQFEQDELLRPANKLEEQEAEQPAHAEGHRVAGLDYLFDVLPRDRTTATRTVNHQFAGAQFNLRLRLSAQPTTKAKPTICMITAPSGLSRRRC